MGLRTLTERMQNAGENARAGNYVNARCVCVQLLVPLLEETVLDARAVPLLDPVRAHDVQDPHADLVPVAAAARQRRKGCAGEHSDGGVVGLGRDVGDALGEGLLDVRDVLRLVVVPARWRTETTAGDPAR